jgi:hypothetical protein
MNIFLASVLTGGEWSASHPWSFIPREKRSWYPLYRRLRWASEVVRKTWMRENSSPYRDFNFNPSVAQPVTSHYTDCPPYTLFCVTNLKICTLDNGCCIKWWICSRSLFNVHGFWGILSFPQKLYMQVTLWIPSIINPCRPVWGMTLHSFCNVLILKALKTIFDMLLIVHLNQCRNLLLNGHGWRASFIFWHLHIQGIKLTGENTGLAPWPG